MLQAVYPLLDQYYLLSKKLLVDLIVAHMMICQFLSVLIQTFTTLAVKVCQGCLIRKFVQQT